MCKRKRNILQFTYDIEECIDVIQEEISKVSFRENIKGMRNRLIHKYWRTSLEMIYEVSVFEMEDLLKYIYLLREKLKY
nr:HepT-like ribonuclease domain-containing protein [uncultured Leptotrichia sp.]